jgi:hypothetical protein
VRLGLEAAANPKRGWPIFEAAAARRPRAAFVANVKNVVQPRLWPTPQLVEVIAEVRCGAPIVLSALATDAKQVGVELDCLGREPELAAAFDWCVSGSHQPLQPVAGGRPTRVPRAKRRPTREQSC